MSKENKAEQYATKAHDGQFRFDGVTPYISHPEEVARTIIKFFKGKIPDEELKILVCSAYLHDTIEDCENVTYEDLVREFGEEIANIVPVLNR